MPPERLRQIPALALAAFQAAAIDCPNPQGVALGWFVPALRTEEKKLKLLVIDRPMLIQPWQIRRQRFQVLLGRAGVED
jgi:hypothetical protein